MAAKYSEAGTKWELLKDAKRVRSGLSRCLEGPAKIDRPVRLSPPASPAPPRRASSHRPIWWITRVLNLRRSSTRNPRNCAGIARLGVVTGEFVQRVVERLLGELWRAQQPRHQRRHLVASGEAVGGAVARSRAPRGTRVRSCRPAATAAVRPPPHPRPRPARACSPATPQPPASPFEQDSRPSSWRASRASHSRGSPGRIPGTQTPGPPPP